MSEIFKPVLVCDLEAVPLDPQPEAVVRPPEPVKQSWIRKFLL